MFAAIRFEQGKLLDVKVVMPGMPFIFSRFHANFTTFQNNYKGANNVSVDLAQLVDAITDDTGTSYLYKCSDDTLKEAPELYNPLNILLDTYKALHKLVITVNDLAMLLIGHHFLLPLEVREIGFLLSTHPQVHQALQQDLKTAFSTRPGSVASWTRHVTLLSSLPLNELLLATEMSHVVETEPVELDTSVLDQRRLCDTAQDHFGLISAMLLFARPLRIQHNITFPPNLNTFAETAFRNATAYLV